MPSTEQEFFFMPRAGVLVYFVHQTDSKPHRFCVNIRGFERRYYSAESAPHEIPDYAREQYFAQRRIDELKLQWKITGAAFIPKVGYIFTIN